MWFNDIYYTNNEKSIWKKLIGSVFMFDIHIDRHTCTYKIDRLIHTCVQDWNLLRSTSVYKFTFIY